MDVVCTEPIKYKSKTQEFRLYYFSDFHIGAASCDEKRLKRDIKEAAKDDNAIVFLGGDILDCIVHRDSRRFDPKSIAPWIPLNRLDEIVQVQVERAAELLAPIAPKVMGMVTGNHEEAIRKHEGQDPSRQLANELSAIACRPIDSHGTCVWWRAAFERYGRKTVYDIYCHHGWMTGSDGNIVNKMDKALGKFHCDLLLVGHGHKRKVTEVTSLGVDQKSNITSVTRNAVMSGAYLQTYMEGTRGYGEDKGYDPTTMGVVPVTLRPHTKEISVNL